MFKQLFAGLCCLGFIACLGNRPAHEASSLEAVNAVVGRYVESINAADTGLARQVWAEDADISLIHPKGHETQVLWRAAGGEWRIVHVHYSGLPAATPSQGL